MALITDYTSLKDNIADWINRDDLTGVIPTFIQLVESNLNQTLRLRQMLVEATLTWSADDDVPLPNDFLEIYDLEESYPPSSFTVPPLRYVGSEELKQIKAALPSGTTRWYTVTGNIIEIWPPPTAGGFNMTLTYYAAIPSLSGSNLTNWLLTKAPDLYLFGSLLQASPYLKNDQRIPVWDAGYQRTVTALTSESERSMRPATTLVARKRIFG